MRRMTGRAFSKISSPKLMDPQLRVAMSGLHASGPTRSSGVMPTAPPVDTCTITSVRARIASIASWKRALDCVGRPSGSRACKWITAAPASRQRTASTASSSAV